MAFGNPIDACKNLRNYCHPQQSKASFNGFKKKRKIPLLFLLYPNQIPILLLIYHGLVYDIMDFLTDTVFE